MYPLIDVVRFDSIENPAFPKAWVTFAKEQNKRMGTQQMFNPTKFVALVGVKGSKDDCSPIEQSDAPQAIDRSGDARRGRKSKVIEADGPTVYDARMPDGMAGVVEGFSTKA